MKFIINNTNKLKKLFYNKTMLVTGVTGSFGKACILEILKNIKVEKVIILKTFFLKKAEKSKFHLNMILIMSRTK